MTRRLTAATLLLAATLAGCGEPHRPESAAVPPVTVTRLAFLPAGAPATETLAGVVLASRRADLAPRVPGTWAEVAATEGDKVTAGKTLARIHAPEWESRVLAAEANRALAASDRARTAKLLAADAATPAEMDAADARLKAADAALAEARAHAADTAVIAPFAGLVTRKFARPGDAALPGMPVLTVEDPTSLEIEVAFPESSTAPAPGQKLAVEIAGVRLAPAVTEATPAADPATRTRTVRAALTAEEIAQLPARPVPGAFARVFAAMSDAGPRVFLPAEAVVRRGQIETVWVDADGKASPRIVRVGPTAGDRVEILSGLNGTESVLKPSPELVEGAPLR